MKKTLLTCGAFILSLFGVTQTTTFNYTGSMQTYTVPANISNIQIECYGASGYGDTTIAAPGYGGYVSGEMNVTPGQTFNIYVGGTGVIGGPGGWNGGGSSMGNTSNWGGSGGGASDVRLGGTTLTDRIIVAGGGGGGANNGGPAPGGDGGGLTGLDGQISNPWSCTNFTAATGGSQSAGGLGGTSTGCSWDGTDGVLGVGGDSYNNYACAGGGGGYYGGGGAHNGGGGGGGSSYADASVFTNTSHTQGVQYGDGMIVITELCSSTSDSISVADCDTYTAPSGTVYTVSGNYSDTISNTAGCDSIIFIDLTVNTIDNTVNVSGITIESNEMGASYQWLDCNNGSGIVAGATAMSYTPSMDGSYAVEVTNNGCVDTSACTTISGVGVETLTSLTNVEVYPNPSKGLVNVDLAGLNDVAVTVKDISGKVIYHKEDITENIHKFELNESKGVYFLTVRSAEGERTIKMVLN